MLHQRANTSLGSTTSAPRGGDIKTQNERCRQTGASGEPGRFLVVFVFRVSLLASCLPTTQPINRTFELFSSPEDIVVAVAQLSVFPLPEICEGVAHVLSDVLHYKILGVYRLASVQP